MKPIIIMFVAGACCGCALLQKADPAELSYLTLYRANEPAASVAQETSHPLAVRLRRVRSAEHLGPRVVVRRNQHDVTFLDRSRWTDPPRDLVDEHLSRVLFERHGITRIVAGAGPTLEVDVRAFELVMRDKPVARVQLTCLLYEDGRALFEHTFVHEEPVPPDAIEDGAQPLVTPAFAKAMGQALDHAVDALAGRVIVALSAPPAVADR
jgi:ABC-type uncharacterized transport system auxiliary subunit